MPELAVPRIVGGGCLLRHVDAEPIARALRDCLPYLFSPLRSL
ncbi:hypothetical protein ACEU0G_001642 [Stenotrophomonas nematodicola]|uniref:Uncharacterized protein n=1 Tax=Stenotrophomonas nematodicola TaxID=2656746 RepID=A0ABW7CT79_9GAMM